MFNKRKKKFQFGGQLHNLVPEFKPWGYSTFYAKKDTTAIGNAAQSLQNVYEDRLKSKNEYLKAINDMELGPYYGEFKKQKVDELKGDLNQKLGEANNDITSDVFAKGMIDIVGKTMSDPKLSTAKWNYKMSQDYITKRDELSKEGKYNPMFDANAQTYDKIKKGEDLWTPWDYKAIIPYHDYNAKINDIAKGVAADQDIVIESVSDYDNWVTKIKTVGEKKVFDYIMAQKEGFFAGPEGTTFQITTAKSYNANLPAGATAIKFDENGYPILDANFIKYRDTEFTKLVLGISKGVSYSSKEDVAMQTAQGKLRMDEAAANAKAAADNRAASDKAGKEQEQEPGLFAAPGATAQLMEYSSPGIATSFDYESNYNNAYNAYNGVYNQFKQSYSNYSFTDKSGQKMTHDQLLTSYVTNGIDELTIKNGDNIISDSDRVTLDTALSNVVYQKNLVKASAESINANDTQIVNEMKKITNKDGRLMFTMNNQSNKVTLGNGSSVSYKKMIDGNNNELWLVTDGDKGYVDKIVTPAEFKEMYKVAPDNASIQASQQIYEYEKEVESKVVQEQKRWIEDNMKNELQSSGGVFTDAMVQSYRQSKDYTGFLANVKKEVLSKNTGAIYENYFTARANLALRGADPVTRKENYTTLPADLKTSKDAKTERMRTLVMSAEAGKQQYTYVEINGKGGTVSNKNWDQIKTENAEIITVDGWFRDSTESLDLQYYIDGYDVSNTIGGNWVGRIGFDINDLKARFGGDKENDPKWATMQNKLNSMVKDGTLTLMGDKYVFANKQYLVPSHQVSEEFFRNTMSSDQNIIAQGVNNYNTAMSAFNTGESVVVYPAANNTVVTLAKTTTQDGLEKYALTYVDSMNIKKTEIYDDLADASSSILKYNQVMSHAAGQLREHDNVKFNSTESFNAKTNTVASNLVSKVVQGYIGSKANTKEYIKDTTPDKDKIIMGSNINGNQIKIDAKANTYGSRSVINILRQVAYVNSIDEYGNPIYDTSYSNLTIQDRTDLSDNANMTKAIDMKNPAQLNMLRSIFGTDNIEISYPDNGNPDNITITVKNN